MNSGCDTYYSIPSYLTDDSICVIMFYVDIMYNKALKGDGYKGCGGGGSKGDWKQLDALFEEQEGDKGWGRYVEIAEQGCWGAV